MTSESLIGRTLGGRYRIDRLIGRGGMAAVYEATDTEGTRRRVALKVLTTDDSTLSARFHQEALATARLRCPQIVDVYDFVGDGEHPLLVMELVEGESLQQKCAREGLLAVGLTARIATEILAGLAAAHEAGIIHRDVKPSNVLVASDGRVKLVDFGVAKVLGPTGAGMHTATGSLAGTPAYAAPEQLRNQEVDARTDIHGVGVCCYRMLSGSHPWAGTGPVLSAAILMDAPPALHAIRPDVPPGFSSVIAIALAKAREDRFQNAAEMIDAIAPWTHDNAPAPSRSSLVTIEESLNQTTPGSLKNPNPELPPTRPGGMPKLPES